MPQKIPKNLARKITKSVKAIEKKDEISTSQQQTVAAQKFEEIPDTSFRRIDTNYKAYADNYKAKYYQMHPELHVEPDPYVSGYIQVVPTAPGTYIDLGSPDYPRVFGSALSKEEFQKSSRPIVVIRNEKDLNPLIKLGLFKDPQAVRTKISELEFEDKCLWILPDGKIFDAPKTCGSLSDAIAIKQLEQSKKVDDLSPKKPKMTEEQLFKTIKKYFYSILVFIIVFLVGYFYLQSKYFGSTINGKPVEAYYKRLGLKSGASQEEIKKAYRRIALKLHPDRNPNCSDCELKFSKAAEAYKYLLEQEGVEEAKIPTMLDEDNMWVKGQKR
ncbi:Chaperone_protein dnaJ [Hexamita inflata]|uniref:Chaperone protein dnaJ n=1 Tax=Hexamita inflata TaxID=28002 RepID=A0AA86NWK5_9EUKA|nr:Chaperone protein dnaJ [Hexamita inflata]